MKGPQLTRRGALTGAAALAALPLASGKAARPAGARRWLGAWGAALQSAGDAEPLPAGARIDQTIVSSLAGSPLRLRLSNEHGAEPLALAGIRIRAGGVDAALPALSIPPGAAMLTDPVRLSVKTGGPVEVSLTLAGPAPATNIQRTSDRKGATLVVGGAGRDIAPMILGGVDVEAAERPVLVILGDTKSAGPGTWPEHFAASAKGRIGVVNRSMFGGLLALGAAHASALARFDRDVLATPGVTHLLIFTGNNDLIQPGMISGSGRLALPAEQMLSAEQLIAFLAQTVRRARDAGIAAVGGTWLPYEGVTIAQGYSTPEKLAKRDVINAWIRSEGAFDSMVDFDAALRDPAHPQRLLPAFDSGNRFTPNDAGYRRMAEETARVLLA